VPATTAAASAATALRAMCRPGTGTVIVTCRPSGALTVVVLDMPLHSMALMCQSAPAAVPTVTIRRPGRLPRTWVATSPAPRSSTLITRVPPGAMPPAKLV